MVLILVIERPTLFQKLESIFEIEEYLTAKKILLVTGEKSFELSGAKARILKRLKTEKFLKHIYKFTHNPNFDELVTALEDCSGIDFDLIIALGGGTILDYAKLIKRFMLCDHQDIPKEIMSGSDHALFKDIPIIAIPTSAGTGSEATSFAVIYLNNEKYSVSHRDILPNIVVHDASLPLTNTQDQKISQGLDALAQAIESFWSVRASSESQDFALKSINLIVKKFPIFLSESSDTTAVKEMQLGSFYAGKAINISKTTAPHAWSYYLSSNFNVPHGIAVWYTLPRVFDIHYISKNIRSGFEWEKHKINMGRLCKSLCIEGPKPSEIFKIYLSDLGLNIDICDFSYEVRKSMLNSANFQRMSNNPISFKRAEEEYIFNLENSKC